MLSYGFLFTQIFSLLLVLVWLGLVFYALLALRRRTLNATAKALWALIILAIPMLGAVAFFIVQPQDL
ncbi:PLDc N-terminal domain-containing protein [uncultured Thermanaerothrix sp.]|uniref:PLDc N-terminal domain-containing protein n=1 Tax=uncultured Thermanaerothrix sp. TaxID=1195149 RepID=UPI002627AD58|nr:PLDc N-terminal domain-containing protein [uncultured Thermanaerothrix sp.]